MTKERQAVLIWGWEPEFGVMRQIGWYAMASARQGTTTRGDLNAAGHVGEVKGDDDNDHNRAVPLLMDDTNDHMVTWTMTIESSFRQGIGTLSLPLKLF